MRREWSGLQILGAALLLLSVLGFWWGGKASWGTWYPVAHEGTPILVAKAAGQDLKVGGTTLAKVPCPQESSQTCHVLPQEQQGLTTLTDSAGNIAATYYVIGWWQLAAAGGAILCLLVGLPWVIYPRHSNAWLRMLSETDGGLSLSRVQMALWGGATAVAYFALAITEGAFVNAPDEIWKLLLLAGATAGISLGANPDHAADTDKLRSDTKGLLERLRMLAPTQAPLPPEVTQALTEAGAALDAALPGAWEPARGLVERSILEMLIALKSRLPVPQDLLDGLTQTLSAEPTDQALTAARDAWATVVQDVKGTQVFSPETEDAIKALSGYWGSQFCKADQPAFITGASRAVDLMLRDLLASQIELPAAVQRAVRQVRTDLALADQSAPKLSDLVENWRGEGDFSRLQYLILTIGAVAVFLVQFFRTGDFPVIPDQFLWLVGASQATYLGVKWGQKLLGTNQQG